MLVIPPAKFRKHRRPLRRKRVAAAAPLVLVAAGFDDATETVALAFDRAVDVSAIDPAQVSVSDAAGTGWAYVGSGVASQPTPATVVLTLAQAGSAEGPTVLSASATTGIVAADDGGAWAGATELGLPYP